MSKVGEDPARVLEKAMAYAKAENTRASTGRRDTGRRVESNEKFCGNR